MNGQEPNTAPAPDGRKFLLIDPLDHPVVIWIDDDGTCEEPVCRGGDHHLYVDQFSRKWAIRCPKSLSKQEQGRVFWDQPPGSATSRVKEYRANLFAQRDGE